MTLFKETFTQSVNHAFFNFDIFNESIQSMLVMVNDPQELVLEVLDLFPVSVESVDPILGLI